MGEVADILVAHYNAVREEEMERIRHRDQYVTQFSIAVAAIAGVYVSNPAWWGLVALVPFLALVTAFMYAHTDATLGSLSRWLRFEYTAMLGEHFKNSAGQPLILHHWDGAGSQAQYVRSIVFASRYLCIALLLGGAALAATAVVMPLIRDQYPVRLYLFSSLLYSFTGLSAIAPLLAWAKRIQQVKL